jgi:hypothetical protein
MNHDQIVDVIVLVGAIAVLLLGISLTIWPGYFMRTGWNWKGSYLKDWPPNLVRLFGMSWIGLIAYVSWPVLHMWWRWIAIALK